MRRCLAAALVSCAVAVPVAGHESGTGQERNSLAVVLIIDVSFSMYQYVEPSERLEAVTDVFLAALRSGDRAWFGRVAGPPTFTGMFEPTSTYVADQAAIFQTTPAEGYGASPLWDAIDGALRRLEGAPGRRHVILWTDGRASGNHASLHDVVARAQASRISIHVACVPTYELIPQTPTTAVRVRPSVYLQSMAEVTGGVFVSVRGIGGAEQAIDAILARVQAPAGPAGAVLR